MLAIKTPYASRLLSLWLIPLAVACGSTKKSSWHVVALESVKAPAGADFTWDPTSEKLEGMQLGFPKGALSEDTQVEVMLQRHKDSGKYRLTVNGDHDLVANYFMSLPSAFVEHVTVDHLVDHGLHFTPAVSSQGYALREGSALPHHRITIHGEGAVVVEHEDWGHLTKGHDSHDAEAPVGIGAPPALGWSMFGGAVFTVTSTNDFGVGSLRRAIELANANAGADQIYFSVGFGPVTISSTSALPTITDALTIDGSTQGEFSATPLIELDGTVAGANVNGFVFAPGSNASKVRGIIVNSFNGNAIDVAADDVSVLGCYLGVDATGSSAKGNRNGIVVGAASRVAIGNDTASERNIISGNREAGIVVEGSATIIKGNYIGTNASGTADVANGEAAIVVKETATDVTISENKVVGDAP